MRPTTTLRMFQPTKRMMRPVPVSHTISQRLRAMRKIPPELIPLGIVVGVAVVAAFYSLGRKLVVDKQMRLSRQKRVD
ncbi:NADH dehydrogenase [Hyphodiscus hymeniophilus]|uniref:NADH dehydrogenase n=1 Tax=Hyphodiscus hymeniophilus TaxID=353542 RepID=A0A9P6SLN1_9HELO|nr:NADH dehydrogenase [Hyphodiscus hymeniophilus]